MTKQELDSLITRLDTQSDKVAEKVIMELEVIGKMAVPALLLAAKNHNTPRTRKWAHHA